jgi:hypothetical protein
MNTIRKNVIAAVGFALLVSSTSLAFAEFKPSATLQATCMPDAFLLCSSSLFSMDSVIACLREKKSQASAACQAKYDEESKAAEPKATAAK